MTPEAVERPKTKPFDELTDVELVALTPEQVQRYVDLACAEVGVPVLPKPVTPGKAAVQPDLAIYVVGGFRFTEQIDAESVADLVSARARVRMEHDRTSWKDQYAVPDDQPVEVKRDRVFSQGKFAAMHEAIRQGELAVEEFETAKQAYDVAFGQRMQLAQAVIEHVAKARSLEEQRARLREQFVHYLDLADYSVGVARRFMLKAYPDAGVLIPDLFSDEGVVVPPRAIHLVQRDGDEEADVSL